MAAGTSDRIEQTTSKMPVEFSDAEERWRRLIQLGPEEGLRDAGFSEETISVILDRVKKARGSIYSDFFTKDGMTDWLSEVKDGRSVLLALLGRGESVHDLELYSWSCGELGLVDAMALCMNLGSNVNLRSLDLDGQPVFATQEGCALLCDALRTNSTLRSLRLERGSLASTGVKILMDNSTLRLEELHIKNNDLKDEDIAYGALMLRENTTLKTLGLSSTGVGFKGAECMSFALENNTTLESLFFEGNATGKEGMQKLLAPLSDVGGAHGGKNTTLKQLDIGSTTFENFSVESVALMIRTNNTLSTLGLDYVRLLTQDWVDQIIPALRENQTLKSLSLLGCEELTGEVYDALMELIQFTDTGLEDIELHGTGIEDRSGRINEELRVNKMYRGRLRGQEQVKPKSGRLVLCGYCYDLSDPRLDPDDPEDTATMYRSSCSNRHNRIVILLSPASAHNFSLLSQHVIST